MRHVVGLLLCTTLFMGVGFYPEFQKYWVRILTWSGANHRGFAYAFLETVQKPGMCSAVYRSAHFIKKPIEVIR